MSSFMIRLLALFAMFVDHAGLALFPRIGAFRCVGRLAFPLYCFLLTQGYLHTRDLRGYAKRLLLLALLSEIPFDHLIFNTVSSGIEQNVLFSLLLGLFALHVADNLRNRPRQRMLEIIAVFATSMFARVSFGWLGPALCLWFYKAKDNKPRQAAGLLVIQGLYSLSLYLSGVAISWVLVSLCAMFAALPILLYNGKPGPRPPLLSFLFYIAYPLHMMALVVLRAMRIIPPYFFG